MDEKPKSRISLIWPGIVLLQYIMSQVVTFIFSLIFPITDTFITTRPGVFIFILGICFTIGIFLTGWVAIHWRWLKIKPVWIPRLVGTLIGAFVPLILALILYHPIEPGNPFFFISIFAAIIGFYIPGLLPEKESAVLM